ncbi:MAG: transposase family protein, partial [Desulfobulbaceae bacterium]|nr:transposase family protein [Desulfobulbaceae bacterium]
MLEQTETSIHLYVDLNEPVAPVCSACGTVHHAPIHRVGGIQGEDLPLSGKRVFLYVPKRKARCPQDGKIRVEQFSWLRCRFTTRFAEQVYRLTSITTNAEAGWFLGLDDETVYRIDRGILEELAREKLSPVPAPKTMSVVRLAAHLGNSKDRDHITRRFTGSLTLPVNFALCVKKTNENMGY